MRVRPPDPKFSDPRLVDLYDGVEGERSDLDAYVALTEELGARHVVDVGCGTGSLAILLAERGLDAVGVDPASASVDVARRKPHADRVTWIDGDATAVPDLDEGADLVVMTGNVAQVFVDDEDWHTTLGAVHRLLRPGGWFVFETRRPEVRDWERWTSPPTPVQLPDGRTAITSCTVTKVAMPLLSFEDATTVDGVTLRSSSTLRFRERGEIQRDLQAHGFAVVEIRDAPDRPGKKMVVLAQRLDKG